MVQTTLFFLFLFIPFIGEATDLKPWFKNDYETVIRLKLLYQNYNSIATPEQHNHHHHRFKRNANDFFATLSVMYPFKRYCGEFEMTAADTHHQRYRFDNYRITGRYQWLNELEGNTFSLVTGLTLTQPYSRALHDISSFHHGHLEAEAHLSFGKKYGFPCSTDYLFRWWNVFGFGISDVGSPWIREEAAFEYNYEDTHYFRAFIHTLLGLGGKNLDPQDFTGYGSIKHRSVDLGIRYGFTPGCWGTFSLQYARRVYAHNFPKNANLVLIEYCLPFRPQVYTNY